MVILLIPQGERQAFDQNTFHYRVIARFAAALPWPPFADYESATTPGYHYLLAFIHRATGGNLTALRLAGALWGIALIGIFTGALVGRVASVSRGLILALPLACSLYIVSATTGLLPDAAAWCLVAALLTLALRPRVGLRTLGAMGFVLLALVLIRQIHLWAASLLVAAAWFGSRTDDAPHITLADALLGPRAERAASVARAALACLFTLPAILALAWFARLWGGLVPPAFSAHGSSLTTHEYTRVSGFSPLTPGFILALIGGLSLFYAGFLWPTIRRGSWLAHAMLAGLVGCIVAALPISTWSLETGRYSGLWNLVRRFPTIADRSPLIVIASGIGAASLTLWCKALPWRERFILGSGLVAFTLAHSAQALVWQRYSEPLLIMLFGLAAAGVSRGSPAAAVPRWAWAGPLLLALANAGITASAMLGDKNPAPSLGVVAESHGANSPRP